MNDQLPTPPMPGPAPAASPAVVASAAPAATGEPIAAEPATYLGGLPKTLTLPSGHTVTFRDPEDLTGDDHRAVVDGIKDTTRELSAGMDVIYGAACMLIDTWTFPSPIPRTDTAQLGALKFRDYNTIIKAVAPIAGVLFQDLNSTIGAGEPGSPTPPVSD